jgi:hypothetical protein
VEPGEAIAGLIYSENITRRHMTSGQRSMTVAVMFPDGQHGGDRRSSLKIKLDMPEINKGYL